MTVESLPPESLRAAIHALYDYKFETERYLGSWKPHSPKPADLCCDEHRARFEQAERWNQELAVRLREIIVAIGQFEELLAAAEVEVPT